MAIKRSLSGDRDTCWGWIASRKTRHTPAPWDRLAPTRDFFYILWASEHLLLSHGSFILCSFLTFCKQDLPCPFGFRCCLSCLFAFSGCQPTCFLIVTAPASDSSALPYAFFARKKMIRQQWCGLGRGKLDDKHRSGAVQWSDGPSTGVTRNQIPALSRVESFCGRRLFRLRTNYRTRSRHLSKGS